MKIWQGYQKGVNLGGWISQCKYEKSHYDTFITEQDIERIAGFGVDHVRLPLDFEVIQTPEGAWREEGFGYIDRCIAWCKKRGLRVVLDLHKTVGYSFNRPSASDGFFADEALQDRFVGIWEALAKRYGSYEEMMAFELLNEIVNPECAGAWNKIARRAIETIRRYAPGISILVGGVYYNSIYGLAYLDDPYDENIVYNFHCYEPMLFTHQSAPWHATMPKDMVMEYPATIEEYREKTKVLDQTANRIFEEGIADSMGERFFVNFFSIAAEFAEKRNAALYCGEYGVIDKAPVESILNWYRDIHAAFEKFGIGRAAWTYKKMNFDLIGEHYKPILNQIIPLL